MSGAFHVELPPSTAAKEALYSYLYQMAEQLNAALAHMPGDTLTQAQTKAVQEIAGSVAGQTGKSAAAQATALKSLITKTADTIYASMDELETSLRGEYLAVS